MTLHIPHPRPGSSDFPATSFVAATLRLRDPGSDILVRHVRLLRDCVALAQQRWSFEVEAAAVLPTELLLLCQFDDTEFAVGGALKLIKSSFKRHLPGSPHDLWADTCDMSEIEEAAVALRCMEIENAPVRAGLVMSAADWPFSSVHKAGAKPSTLGANVA